MALIETRWRETLAAPEAVPVNHRAPGISLRNPLPYLFLELSALDRKQAALLGRHRELPR